MVLLQLVTEIMFQLLYIIFNKSDASYNLILDNDIITRYTVGGIPRKTTINKGTNIQTIISRIIGDIKDLPIDTTTPNTRYKIQDLGTLSSNPNENTLDLDDFLFGCCHETGYYGASIGSTITIKDGTYNATWMIVGFDMEHKQVAADGTVYDNGYGIFMIPTKSLFYNQELFHFNNGYIGTGAHRMLNIDDNCTADILMQQAALSNHLVKRNVLLSNGFDNSTYNVSGYEWTTAYCTLMSAGQITGIFGENSTKYDDGEANYKLPYFNYSTWQYEDAWLRGLGGNAYRANHYYDKPWYVSSGSEMKCDTIHGNVSKGIYPLIMIR